MCWLRAGEGCPSGAAEWPRLDPGRFPLLRRCPWPSPHWRPIPWPNCGALAWRRRISTLLVDDLIRDILRWMVAHSGFQQSHCSDQGNALGSLWKQDFKFDPATDSELTASEWLATGKSEWEKVWRRFDEQPPPPEDLQQANGPIPSHSRSPDPDCLPRTRNSAVP